MKKIDLSAYKIKKEENLRPWVQPWQDYAAEIIKTFNVSKPYQGMIFKQAKKNINYLRGKVENVKEKFGTGKLGDKSHYLISTFRARKPWEK